jgi:hypothetical protein
MIRIGAAGGVLQDLDVPPSRSNGDQANAVLVEDSQRYAMRMFRVNRNIRPFRRGQVYDSL